MSARAALMKIVLQEDLNFLLTNRIPRRGLTRFMGWFSRIEQPLVRDASLLVWRLFSPLDLADAQEQRFRSLHHCFTRRLKPGARPVDPDPRVLVSPCAAGRVEDDRAFQVKGAPYSLTELLGGDAGHAASLRGASYATLRLTASMYHRFHAPHDCRVERVTHIAGDAWNVNPAALRRVDSLFCRNERAVIRLALSPGGQAVTLVPVAAILVAGIRRAFLDMTAFDRDATGTVRCDARLARGEEMGWFEHGSTILVFGPPGSRLHESLRDGQTIRMGRPLLRLDCGR